MKLENWIEGFFKKRIPEIEELISFGETREQGLYVAIFETEDEDNHVIANFSISVSKEDAILLTNIKVC